jgi:hypothetical protein
VEDKVENVCMSSIKPSVVTINISICFRNFENRSFKMQLEFNLLPNQDVRLVVKGGNNMANVQLLFIVTTKKRLNDVISNHQARLETPHHHH